jgi:DnaK suppressor protein
MSTPGRTPAHAEIRCSIKVEAGHGAPLASGASRANGGRSEIPASGGREYPRPPVWVRSGSLVVMPDQTLLSSLREQLESERVRLRAQISTLDSGGGMLSYDENFADSGQVAAELGENMALLNQLNEQLDEVERALAKFDQGKYGLCERCGEQIAEARLEAIPATRFCVNHA